MNNTKNRWYCLDMENVIALREAHIPKGKFEENDFMFGYLKEGFRPTLITRLFHKIMEIFHMSFMIHAEFKGSR